jgi:hypothetical protein
MMTRFLTHVEAHLWSARLVYGACLCAACVLGYLGNSYVW